MQLRCHGNVLGVDQQADRNDPVEPAPNEVGL
jgi:hypothetical protein